MRRQVLARHRAIQFLSNSFGVRWLDTAFLAGPGPGLTAESEKSGVEPPHSKGPSRKTEWPWVRQRKALLGAKCPRGNHSRTKARNEVEGERTGSDKYRPVRLPFSRFRSPSRFRARS